MSGTVLGSGFMVINKNVTVLALRALTVVREQKTEEGISSRGHGVHKLVEVGWREGISQGSVCSGWQCRDGVGMKPSP